MKALYRKYRPLSLTDVVGESQVTKSLESSLKTGKISHAYLFTGPRGCGKTSVARIFAHEVNGFPYALEDSYSDIIEIDAASNTGVDNIRELRERAAVAPSQGRYKVYIIDEVHMLSKSAFNALLKTLEEPPRHVIFIMATTDAYKIPDTIISRAQVYNFHLADPEVMQKHLKDIAKKEKIAIDDAALDLIISRGGGSFRDTISLLDQVASLASGQITAKTLTAALGLPEDQKIANLLAVYESGDLSAISDRLKELLSGGVKPEIIAEKILEKIVENPRPTLLPLLKSLPDVQAPFAEAKLLLALTEKLATPVAVAKVATTATPVSPKSPTSVATAPEPVVAPENPNPPKVPKTPENPPEGPETAKSGVFDWENYVEAVKSSNRAIWSALVNSTYRLENHAVLVTPTKSFHKNILESPANIDVLKKHLPEGFALTILEVGQGSAENSAKNSATKDSTLSRVSDIMGVDIQEVQDNDGDPF